MKPTASLLSSILGIAIESIVNGEPQLASGEPLTGAQQRAIAALIEHGVPDTIDAAAVDFEASRRTDALVPPRARELLQTQGLAACVAAIDALYAGATEPPSDYVAAKANLALVAQAVAIETAAATIKAGTLPPDYPALVAAYDSILNP